MHRVLLLRGVYRLPGAISADREICRTTLIRFPVSHASGCTYDEE